MIRYVLLTLLPLVGTATYVQAESTAKVEIAEVRFGEVRDAAGQLWWGAEVDLQVQAGSGGGQARFADQVGVELQWGVESAGPEGGFLFFRAAARAAAIEAGRVVYRFYLPPAVVRRERIENEPRFWAVQVAVAGQVLPDSRRSVGSGFSGPEALASFRRQLAAHAPAHDGVLLPWYLSPFAVTGGTDAPVPVRWEPPAPQR